MKIGNFNPSPEVLKESEKIAKEDEKKYQFCEKVVCECEFNAGLFFEQDLKEVLAEEE